MKLFQVKIGFLVTFILMAGFPPASSSVWDRFVTSPLRWISQRVTSLFDPRLALGAQALINLSMPLEGINNGNSLDSEVDEINKPVDISVPQGSISVEKTTEVEPTTSHPTQVVTLGEVLTSNPTTVSNQDSAPEKNLTTPEKLDDLIVVRAFPEMGEMTSTAMTDITIDQSLNTSTQGPEQSLLNRTVPVDMTLYEVIEDTTESVQENPSATTEQSDIQLGLASKEESLEISTSTTIPSYLADPWIDYFDYVRRHDVNNCLSLMVCQTSAEPGSFGDYGAKIVDFFSSYSPQADNRAGWWYKNSALMGSLTKSVAMCKGNFPYCELDTKDIVNLMDIPDRKI